MHNRVALLFSGGALVASLLALYTNYTSSEITVFSKRMQEAVMLEPEQFTQAIQKGMARQAEKERMEALANLGERKSDLFDQQTPYFLGNPDGQVTFVEFFDYNCGFCKRAYEVVEEIVQDHPEVKIILKELPILGPSSDMAAKTALAAAKQGKYKQAHEHLLKAEKPLQNEADIRNLAIAIGADPDKLVADTKDPDIQKTLQKNVELAMILGINGTPGFIKEDAIFPGMMSKDQFSKLVQEELAKKGKVK